MVISNKLQCAEMHAWVYILPTKDQGLCPRLHHNCDIQSGMGLYEMHVRMYQHHAEKHTDKPNKARFVLSLARMHTSTIGCSLSDSGVQPKLRDTWCMAYVSMCVYVHYVYGWMCQQHMLHLHN